MSDTVNVTINEQEQTFSSSSDELEIVLRKGHIYKITNPNTERIYIGSTFDLKPRFAKHKNDYRIYKRDDILMSASSLVFHASEDINSTRIEIIESVWAENRRDLERVEKKHLLANKDIVVNNNNLKTDEERKNEHREKMRYIMKKKYEQIPFSACPLCKTLVKKTRLDEHSKTKFCNRRSEQAALE
jgi:predicted GIY-YIG superfamily endonuclease